MAIRQGGALADEADVSNEKKAELDEIMTKGISTIYDEQKAVQNALTENPDNKVATAANVALLVVERVKQSRVKEGRPAFSDDALVMGGYYITNEIANLAAHAGVKPFTDEEIAATYQTAVKEYIGNGIRNRTINPIDVANQVEQVKPGTIRTALAAIPDTPNSGAASPMTQGGGQPPMPQSQSPQAPAGPQSITRPQAPTQQQGLITESPLRGILNG